MARRSSRSKARGRYRSPDRPRQHAGHGAGVLNANRGSAARARGDKRRAAKRCCAGQARQRTRLQCAARRQWRGSALGLRDGWPRSTTALSMSAVRLWPVRNLSASPLTRSDPGRATNPTLLAAAGDGTRATFPSNRRQHRRPDGWSTPYGGLMHQSRTISASESTCRCSNR